MLLFWAVLAGVLFFPPPAEAGKDPDKVWIVLRPVQCLGNPWEKEWMKKNHDRADRFPKKKEFDLMKKYFTKNNVPILAVRLKSYTAGDAVCQACDCPRGDMFYLLIWANDVPKMVKLGYTERLPAYDTPDQKKR